MWIFNVGVYGQIFTGVRPIIVIHVYCPQFPSSGVKLRTAAAQRSRDKRCIPPTRNRAINTTSEKQVCIRVCIGV